MIESLILFGQTLLAKNGSLSIFIAAFFEEIVAIIPSTLIFTASGFFFLEGQSITLSSVLKLLFKVAFPAAIGLTLGSFFIYIIAYLLGRPAIERFGKWFGISWKEIEKMQQFFQKSYGDEIALFLSRSLPIIPNAIISALCGVIRLRFVEYVIFTFLGAFVRASLLGFLGWQVGNAYEHYAKAFSRAGEIVLILFLIGFIAAIIFLKKKKLSPVV